MNAKDFRAWETKDHIIKKELGSYFTNNIYAVRCLVLNPYKTS